MVDLKLAMLNQTKVNEFSLLTFRYSSEKTGGSGSLEEASLMAFPLISLHIVLPGSLWGWGATKISLGVPL